MAGMLDSKSYTGGRWLQLPCFRCAPAAMRVSLVAVVSLGAVCVLLLMLSSKELLVARRGGPAPDPDAGLLAWRERAKAQGYVYAYQTGAMRFPMLALGERLHGDCPGGPHAPPYVTVVAGGRLGNLIMEYAAAWALARAHRLPAFVPDRIINRLKGVFAGLTLRGGRAVEAEDPFCRAAAQPKQGPGNTTGAGKGQQEEGDWRPWGKTQPVDLHHGQLPQVVQDAYKKRALIVLDVYSFLPEAVVPMAAELRKEFVFQPQLRESAQAELLRLRKEHFPDFDGEVVYGAVHARRTDYHAQVKLLYNVTKPAGLPFFVSAAAWLRRTLEPNQRLLLVVASDDASWAQEELVPVLRAAGDVDRASGGWAAAWAGSGDQEHPDRDLALLATCNHTIFTYGTFGLSAALIGGGRAAVFQLASEPLHPTLLTPSEQFARHMPGWVALR